MIAMKSFRTNTFVVVLYQIDDGQYVLGHTMSTDDDTIYSFPIVDYAVADYMFETLLIELVGM